MGNVEGQANWRWQPPRTRPSVLRCLEGSTPSPSAFDVVNDVSLTERQRCQPSKLVRWVRLPQDTLGDRLIGRIPDFESGDVRFESSSPNRE